MLILSNGIRVLIDHVTWYSVRHIPQDLTTEEKWVLQFGYVDGHKTFVTYHSRDEAESALEGADSQIRVHLR
jgi:hypothetical protein